MESKSLTVQRVMYDSEFDEDGETIRPLSLGFYAPCYKCNDTGSFPPNTRQVCDHCQAKGGKGLYVVIEDADRARCNEFVQEHVIPYLDVEPEGCETVRCNRADAGYIILRWLRSLAPAGVRLEFWANFGSYDWVLFAQLFGRMVDMPRDLPQMVNDLKQELMRRGYMRKSEIPDLTQGMQLHNDPGNATAQRVRRCCVGLESIEVVGNITVVRSPKARHSCPLPLVGDAEEPDALFKPDTIIACDACGKQYKLVYRDSVSGWGGWVWSRVLFKRRVR